VFFKKHVTVCFALAKGGSQNEPIVSDFTSEKNVIVQNEAKGCPFPGTLTTPPRHAGPHRAVQRRSKLDQ
jgi:hypothetical protein